MLSLNKSVYTPIKEMHTTEISSWKFPQRFHTDYSLKNLLACVFLMKWVFKIKGTHPVKRVVCIYVVVLNGVSNILKNFAV